MSNVQHDLYQTERKDNFSIIVKPTNDCNFSCKYCYDTEARNKRKGCKLTKEDMVKLIDMTNKYAENVCFGYHGGECTLLGQAYFEDLQDEFISRYATSYIQTMQSNGYLISKDDSWIDFFKSTDIKLGLSFDVIGQEYRDNHKLNSLNKCIDAGVCKGAITVIGNHNATKLIEIYEVAKSTYGSEYGLTYNLAYENIDNPEFILDSNLFLENFKPYAEHWLFDTNNNALNERFASNILRGIAGDTRNNLCSFTDCRGDWLSVYSDGEIHPCDMEMPNYSLGHLSDYESIQDVFNSPQFKKYYNDVQQRYDNYCGKCPYNGLLSCKCVSNHTMATDSKLATTINTNICKKYIGAFQQMYSLVQSTHSKEYLNKYALQIVEETGMILPVDIENFLLQKGHNFKMTVPEEVFNTLSLHETPQYAMFRIFNPNSIKFSYKLELLGKYSIPLLTKDVLLNNLYDSKHSEIEEILERRGTNG